MTALVGIECDGECGRQIVVQTFNQVSTTMIRERAKRAGWHKRYQDGTARDLCPTCWQERKR